MRYYEVLWNANSIMSISMPLLQTKKRASIVITVLILMMVSSFLVLLTMRYFFSMMHGYTSLSNYYKAYYLARWWMDVLVTQHAYRGWWYETQFSWAESDFECRNFGCTLKWSIAARFPRIDASNVPDTNECSRNTAISLPAGQSMIFPLFYDMYQSPQYFSPVNTTSHYDTFGSLQNIDLYIYDQPSTGTIYLYASLDWPFGQTTGIGTLPISTPFTDSQWQPYQKKQIGALINDNRKWLFVIIQNPETGSGFHFCFASSIAWTNLSMIGQTTTLRADAQVQDEYVTLETIKTNRFPSILLQ